MSPILFNMVSRARISFDFVFRGDLRIRRSLSRLQNLVGGCKFIAPHFVFFKIVGEFFIFFCFFMAIPGESPSAARSQNMPQFHPIILKLDRKNYAFWCALVFSSIRAHGFEDFISSTVFSPSPLLPSSSGGEVTPNLEFLTWIRRDQYLFSWMLSSIGESMLGHVVRCRSSRELWSALETVFQSQSKALTMQYRVQLQSTKKENISVEDYFMKMRSIADQLAAIGKPLDDDELIMHLMAGFGPEYEALVVHTMHRKDAPDLQEIQLVFQAYGVRLAQQHTALFEHSAQLAYRGRGGRYPAQFGHGSAPVAGTSPGNFGRGGRQGSNRNMVCQLCGRTGHVALKCFKRFDVHFTGNETNNGSNVSSNGSPKAFLSDFAIGDDAGQCVDSEGRSWYVDSGATAHITHDLSNLAISSDYSGTENLIVGNGNRIHISSIGYNSISVPSASSSSLLLNNILFVPQITKNLLSISQFTKDNNVIIEFNSNSCYVKDKLSHKILLKGPL